MLKFEYWIIYYHEKNYPKIALTLRKLTINFYLSTLMHNYIMVNSFYHIKLIIMLLIIYNI